MSTILLTGGTGFLGSHLLRQLIEDGDKVVLVKRSISKIDRITDLLDKCSVYDLDQTDAAELFKKHKVDVVVHTATNYGRNNAPLSQLVLDNVMFPLSLAEAGIKHGCNFFINTDTFFNRSDSQYDYLRHYTLSKRMLWNCLQELPLIPINCKLEHLYGPGDNTDKFIPTVINGILHGKDSIQLTDGKQRRDFIYVSDAVNAFQKIIRKAVTFTEKKEFEIGTGQSVSVFDFLTEVKSQIRDAVTILQWGALPTRQGEFSESKADTSELAQLGWHNQTTLSDGINKTINYLKEIKSHGV